MWTIKKSVLEDLIQASKNYLPDEFLCFLAGNKKAKSISEIILIPTQNGKTFSSINLYNMPIDNDLVGSVHSHPNGFTLPSKADKLFFKRFKINIIIGLNNIRTIISFYDENSQEIKVNILE
jgi:proteasome lid subunit RPN8/RPN11